MSECGGVIGYAGNRTSVHLDHDDVQWRRRSAGTFDQQLDNVVWESLQKCGFPVVTLPLGYDTSTCRCIAQHGMGATVSIRIDPSSRKARAARSPSPSFPISLTNAATNFPPSGDGMIGAISV